MGAAERHVSAEEEAVTQRVDLAPVPLSKSLGELAIIIAFATIMSALCWSVDDGRTWDITGAVFLVSGLFASLFKAAHVLRALRRQPLLWVQEDRLYYHGYYERGFVDLLNVVEVSYESLPWWEMLLSPASWFQFVVIRTHQGDVWLPAEVLPGNSKKFAAAMNARIQALQAAAPV
jgi:hypothetical protein